MAFDTNSSTSLSRERSLSQPRELPTSDGGCDGTTGSRARSTSDSRVELPRDSRDGPIFPLEIFSSNID